MKMPVYTPPLAFYSCMGILKPVAGEMAEWLKATVC